MALATLCSSIADTVSPCPEFHAFIVDHGIRAKSSDEAVKVASELERLNIRPRILTLDRSAFTADSGPIEHLEGTTRQLRYRALGKACHEHGIESLVVAHHADDQVETVLQRLLGGYLGSGLGGIRAKAAIPDCEGIYGVDESGGLAPGMRTYAPDKVGRPSTHKVMRETGGVQILRPLLPATKSQLVQFCEHSGTKWFEDHTNADVGVATRNAVRHLLKEDVLPEALRRTRVFTLINNITRRTQEIERLARLELDRADMLLDVRAGRVAFTIRKGIFADFVLPPEVEYTAKTVMLRMLIYLVNPHTKVTLSRLHSGVDIVFPSAASGDVDLLFQDQPATVNVAGVQISRVTGTTGFLAYTMSRAAMMRTETEDRRTVLPEAVATDTSLDTPKWTTGWRLWDNRYWIRLGSMQRDVVVGRTFLVRALAPDDRAAVQQGLSPKQTKAFDDALAEVSGKDRFTLPVIVEQHEDGRESIMALPTLDWQVMDCGSWPSDTIPASDQRLLWDIRYKRVDYPLNTTRHKVIDHTPARNRSTSGKPHPATDWRLRIGEMVAHRQRWEARGGPDDRPLVQFVGVARPRLSVGRKYVLAKRKKLRETVAEDRRG